MAALPDWERQVPDGPQRGAVALIVAALVLVAVLLVVMGCGNDDAEPMDHPVVFSTAETTPPKPQRLRPAVILVSDQGIQGWVFCVAGRSVYITDPAGAVAQGAIGSCPTGEASR